MEVCSQTQFSLVQMDVRQLQNGIPRTEPLVPAESVSYYMWERTAQAKGVCVQVRQQDVVTTTSVCSVRE